MTNTTQQEKILKEFHALYQKYGIPSEKRLTEWLSTALQEVAEETKIKAERRVAQKIYDKWKNEQDLKVSFGEYLKNYLLIKSREWEKFSSKEGEGK